MRSALSRFYLFVAFVGVTAFLATQVDSQEPVQGTIGAAQPALGPAPQPDEPPKGIEVMARGPIHEAYAAPNVAAKPTAAIPKKPPAPIEEMAPEDRPEGDVVWIGGYWAYDDERQDFLWVSGCWRVKPEHKEWVPGYWREVGAQWQWCPGFWTNANAPTATGVARAQEVTYYPQPPAPPNLASPGNPPAPDNFYVPGYYQWNGTYYIWRAGYWGRVRPGYVYVASQYRWTPTGFVFIPGYWDYTVARRGVIYAPVVVNSAIVPVNYVYTPVYAVPDTLLTDAMFVRPAYAHYYFGDYYGPQYANAGFVTTVVYSRTYYEPIIVYQRYEYRNNPRWFDLQVNIVLGRNAGTMPVPARTLVQQRTIINNTTIVNNKTIVNNTVVNRTAVLAPAKTVMAARGIPSARLPQAARVQATQSARAVQTASLTQRAKTESAPIAPGWAGKPRTAALSVPSIPVAPKTVSANHTPPPGSTTPTLGHAPSAAPGNTLGTSRPPAHPAGSAKGGTTTPGRPVIRPGTPLHPPLAPNRNEKKKKDR